MQTETPTQKSNEVEDGYRDMVKTKTETFTAMMVERSGRYAYDLCNCNAIAISIPRHFSNLVSRTNNSEYAIRESVWEMISPKRGGER